MRFSSFAEMLVHYAERTPDAPALHYEEGGAVATMTYAQLAHATQRRAEEIGALGKTCMGVLAAGSAAPL